MADLRSTILIRCRHLVYRAGLVLLLGLALTENGNRSSISSAEGTELLIMVEEVLGNAALESKASQHYWIILCYLRGDL